MAKNPSSTPFVILGLLCAGPKSGYDLKADIERAVGHFWSESYGQIYPALKTLHADGLVDRASSPVGGRQKHLYSITEEGREALRGWLSQSAAPLPVRDELLIKVFLGRHGDHQALLGHIREAAQQFGTTARTMIGTRAWLEGHFADDPSLPYWLLCVDRGERVAKARAEWAQHALEVLSGLDEP